MAFLLLSPDAALAAEAAAAIRSVEGIEVEADEVKIRTDQPVQYKAFLTPDGAPRLVIDLFDTQYRTDDKNLPAEGKILQRVRGAQYSMKPQRVARVVMDLAEAAAYEVVSLPDGLRVRLGEATALAAKAASQEAEKLEASWRDAPGPETAAEVTEKAGLSDEAPKESVPSEVRVGPGTAAAPASRGSAGRREIMASLPREKVNLDFDATDVRDILKLLGVRAGVNMIYGSDVGGSLSLHLKQVPFDEAFKTVMQMSNLTTQQVGDNILRVLTPEVLKMERGKALPTTRVFQLSYTKAEEMKTQIDAVRTAEGRPGATVVSKTVNSLIVTDTQEGLLQVERLIAQLDRRPRQVLIEAKLIEVQHSKGFDMGIQWDYSSDSTRPDGSVWFVGTNDPTKTAGPTSPSTNRGGANLNNTGGTGRGTGVNLPAATIVGALTLGRVTSSSLLAATISAAARTGKAKVLSDPKVATLNNEEAKINITTQIPYVTSSVTSTGVATESVSYVNVGITLTVTPTINADGRVTLKIKPEVSQPSATAVTAGTTGAPTVDTRNADTKVLVRDGETIVIGGLITDSESVVMAKVPLLGDIPILGWFFRKKSTSRTRQELLVFVTPKILD